MPVAACFWFRSGRRSLTVALLCCGGGDETGDGEKEEEEEGRRVYQTIKQGSVCRLLLLLLHSSNFFSPLPITRCRSESSFFHAFFGILIVPPRNFRDNGCLPAVCSSNFRARSRTSLARIFFFATMVAKLQVATGARVRCNSSKKIFWGLVVNISSNLKRSISALRKKEEEEEEATELDQECARYRRVIWQKKNNKVTTKREITDVRQLFREIAVVVPFLILERK